MGWGFSSKLPEKRIRGIASELQSRTKPQVAITSPMQRTESRPLI